VRRLATAVTAALLVAGGIAAGTSSADAPHPDVSAARRATSSYHDVRKADAAGYVSTLDALGCFEKDGVGGMGLHYVNFDLVDDGGVVDAAHPEALVYEMRDDGGLKLVGHEYLVPSELVDPSDPPMLFGHHFHPHPVLPFWILHAWVWRPNPDGMFADFNPAVRMCPDGVPIFGS
jgi:hypothetical protein